MSENGDARSMKTVVMLSVLGLAILVAIIIILPELEIVKLFLGATGAESKTASSVAVPQDILKIKLQYFAIIIIVVCLTIGICIILYLSLTGSGRMDQTKKLQFSLKYVAIAIIANAAFMLGILDDGKDGDTVDKIITLYAGIAGYVLGSASETESIPTSGNKEG